MARKRFALMSILAGGLAAITAASCKVAVSDINASFALADAAWFEEEQTLFLFYDVRADQGVGPESVVEVTYTTDDLVQPWTPIASLPKVHEHVVVDCGVNTKCGSTSIYVAKVPRSVGLRLRYHYDGEVTLGAHVLLNVVAAGPAWSNRSLVVYGVFDATNTYVQWRGRHQMPTLRNEEVEQLGLRRRFVITGARYGTLPSEPPPGNEVGDSPYLYGFASSCPEDFLDTGHPGPIETSERAVFDPEAMPLAIAPAPIVCANATVYDAIGAFTTAAVARKNPEVRPAFPALRSPIRTDTPMKLLFAPCQRTISEVHKDMQEQRLLLGPETGYCLDEWTGESFASDLAAFLRTRIDDERQAGNDMILTIAVHHDDASGGLAGKIEAALEQVLTPEADKSSPRVTGAFVFDSYPHLLNRAPLHRLALWCPSTPAPQPQGDGGEGEGEEGGPGGAPSGDTSQRTCAVVPDIELSLGPFSVTSLPILPSRAQYLRYLETYSEDDAGKMLSLTFLAPERTPLSENVAIGDFAVATFFNQEILTLAPGNALSYCPSKDNNASPVVFRSALSPDPMPLSMLPLAYGLTPETSYSLGLLWDFPFLVRLEYEITLAGAATAFSASIPFGLSTSTEAAYGAALWTQGEFPIGDILLLCDRFCDHPTFDSAGVYNVGSIFREAYAENCYRPRYPTLADGGFPRDP